MRVKSGEMQEERDECILSEITSGKFIRNIKDGIIFKQVFDIYWSVINGMEFTKIFKLRLLGLRLMQPVLSIIMQQLVNIRVLIP